MPSGKKKQEAAGYDTRVNQAITEVKTVDPLEAKLKARSQKFLDWEDGTGEYAGKPRNILDAPGIGDALDIYGSAESLADTEQMGSGAMRLADPASGTTYGTQMKQLAASDRYNTRAAGLSNALGGIKADATGQIGGLLDRDFARKSTIAGLESSNRRDYYNRPQKQSLFDKLLNGARATAAAAM